MSNYDEINKPTRLDLNKMETGNLRESKPSAQRSCLE